MGEGEGGLNREGGLINFPPLKRGGGAYLRGGLNRGFTVVKIQETEGFFLEIARFLSCHFLLCFTNAESEGLLRNKLIRS